MATTVGAIRAWLKGAPAGTTHMFVATDTFSYEDYPVYTAGPTETLKEYRRLRDAPMTKVMECYDLSQPHEAQLGEFRAWHLPDEVH